MSPRHLSRLSFGAAAIGALALAAIAIGPSRAAEEAVVIPPPTLDVQAADGIQTAVIAGGCFWGVQGVYQHTSGVLNAVSGYSGGSKMTANYTAIGTGTTGHAEAVEIKYDPKKISYGKILQIFFSVVHDPTQLNRQGPDVGTQYRSAIFPQDEEQRAAAEAAISRKNEEIGGGVVTTIEPKAEWYPAEDYHQDYWSGEGQRNPYCLAIIPPKLQKLRKSFQARVKTAEPQPS
jgi:peptide-methionine (S)-S-oxide reductase